MSSEASWIWFPPDTRTEVPAEHRTERLVFERHVDRWIWHDAAPAVGSDRIQPVFTADFHVTEQPMLMSAEALVTADEGYVLAINGREASRSDGRIFSWARPAHLAVESLLKPGMNRIRIRGIHTWVEKPAVCMKMRLRYSDGSEQVLRTDESWSTEGGENVRIAGVMGDPPWDVPSADIDPLPVLHFSTVFDISQPVEDTRLELSALGLVEARIDGERLPGHPELLPGWTDYRTAVPCHTLDAGPLAAGEHRIELLLAAGWYAGYLGWERRKGYYGPWPVVWARLMDGSRVITSTSDKWDVSDGPWLGADLLMGEIYDARCNPGRPLGRAQRFTGHTPDRIPADWEPVRVIDTVKPLSVQQTAEGQWMADFGRILAGVTGIDVSGERGARMRIRHSEVLDGNGALYLEHNRMALAEDHYTLSGVGREAYRPRFTWHGFRYADITVLSGTATLHDIEAYQIGSDLERTGWFTSDSDLVNRIYGACLGSARCTLIDIPADCCQRDERLGWTGDGSILAEFHSQTFDMSRFYAKWLNDLFRAQKADGSLPDIAPWVEFGTGIAGWNNPAWPDAAVWVTSVLLREYGSTDYARSVFPALARYADRIWSDSDGGYRPGGTYGDWLHAGASTPHDLIGTAFHAMICREMYVLANTLGMEKEAAGYRRRFEKVAKAYDDAFLSRQGAIAGLSQTACVLTLRFGLAGPDRIEQVRQRLADDILARGTALTTGFLGTPWLLDELSEMGRSDLAVALLKRDEYPSWGFMIRNGATALWEHWDSYTPEKGFRDPVMNSFSHASLGAFAFWFYKRAGWLRRLDPDTRTIILKPDIAPHLRMVDVRRKTRLGEIGVCWEATDEHVHATIRIPDRAKALVADAANEQGHGLHTSVKKKVLGPGIHTLEFTIKDGRYYGNY